MSLKSIDFISPKLTLYYYGNRRHTSYFGGILTIIMVFFSSSYIFYLLYNIITHKIRNFMLYRTYIVDVEQFNYNDSTGIYHYFQLYDTNKKSFGVYNSKYLRIFMSRLYKSYQNSEEELFNNEHWLYDKCREGLDNKNFAQNLFSESDIFTDGACLRYYYNNTNHKYYPIEDEENFKYPYLIHGSGHKDNLFLGTIIEKCENSSITSQILGSCASDKEIEDYFEEYQGINLQLLSKRVDTENYTQPIYQYFHSICESLDISSVPINNLNIMPFFIEINSGFVFPESKKLVTYSLDFNRRENWEIPQNRKVLSVFYYWLQNSSQVFKGGYSTLYDILPSIGGIIQLTYYIFYSINFVYNKYVIIKDCNRAFFRVYSNEDTKDTLKKRKFSDCIKTVRDESKYIFGNTNKIVTAIKEKRDSIFIAKYNRQKNSLKLATGSNCQKMIEENKQNNNLTNSNDLIMQIQNNIINNTQYKRKNSILKKTDESIDNSNFAKELKEYIIRKNKLFRVEPLNFKITSHFINFFSFLLFIFKFRRSNEIFYALNAYRQKILGEEHIFRSNIILYHLEKYFNIKEIQKIDAIELFEHLS
jgi:hypothetical protein